MKRLLLSLLLLASLAACNDAPDDTVPAADPAPTAAAPAAEPAPAPAEPVTPADATPADAAPTDAAAAEGTPADAGTPPDATASTPAETPPPRDPAASPRRDVRCAVLATRRPTFGQGGIGVAEVCAYTCSHCASLQPSMTPWKAAHPADVRVEYVPAVFGGVADNFARGFFAAQAMGLLDKTHDGMFNAVLVERAVGSGSL